jgi:hypothetical protein
VDGTLRQVDGRSRQVEGRLRQLDGRLRQVDGRLRPLVGAEKRVGSALHLLEWTFYLLVRTIRERERAFLP